MDKNLEDYLWDRIGYAGENKESAYEVIKQMVQLGMIKSPKQGYATLEKWVTKGKYNYGTSLRCGWKEKDEEF